jgi:hypothetical protein
MASEPRLHHLSFYISFVICAGGRQRTCALVVGYHRSRHGIHISAFRVEWPAYRGCGYF